MSLLRAIVGIGVCLGVAQLASAQSSVFGTNLIVNGGAESGPGGDGTAKVSSIPGWQASGGCDIYAYATAYMNIDGVAPTDIVPRGTGNNYFAGGVPPANCRFTQSVALSSGASTIDSGNASFALAGYFGGFQSDGDNATLTVQFLNSGGTSLSSVTIGGIGPNDRANSQSGMYLNRQLGRVPVGARSANVTLNMNWVNGGNNEAAADNLALILNAPVTPQTLLGVNLIVNPGADAAVGLNDNSTTSTSPDLSGWVRSPYLTADSYSSDGSGDLYQPTAGTIPPDANSNYFYGGETVVDDSNPIGTAYLDINVSFAASLIDAGNLAYALSAWLGGYSSQDDNAVLTVQFEDWSSNVLGTATLGPVLAADRNDISELLQRSTNATVPKTTRLIHVLLTMTREEGINNDGLADSLSLVLGSNPVSGPEISQTIISASAYGGFDAVTNATYMEIYGANLARDERQWAGADFNGVNAPTSLDGTSVTVGGQPAYIYFISSGQINALVPGNVSGPQPVVVTTANGASVPFILSVNPVEPGWLAPSAFNLNGSQYVGALFSDGKTWALPPGAVAGVPSRRANVGNVLTIYGLGFGPVTPPVPTGQVTQGATQLTAPFQVMVGSTAATLQYWGLVAPFVGLYQFNVVVPNVPANDLTPISFTLGGAAGAQTLYIAVQ